jgi:hypothetical protein
MKRQAGFHVDPQVAAVFLSISDRTGESIRDEVSAIYFRAAFAQGPLEIRGNASQSAGPATE